MEVSLSANGICMLLEVCSLVMNILVSPKDLLWGMQATTKSHTKSKETMQDFFGGANSHSVKRHHHHYLEATSNH